MTAPPPPDAPKPEPQTCPRRMYEAGPWEYAENLDAWRVNDWSPDGQPITPKRSSWRVGVDPPPERYESNRWGWSWQPRTCSFCGGAHPDDVLRLLDEGWEIGSTSKRYKVYLEPPGSRDKHRALMANITDFSRAPSVWSPVPPVKVYFQHFTQEQGKMFEEREHKARRIP